MLHWIERNEALISWIAAGSAVSFVATLVIIPLRSCAFPRTISRPRRNARSRPPSGIPSPGSRCSRRRMRWATC